MSTVAVEALPIATEAKLACLEPVNAGEVEKSSSEEVQTLVEPEVNAPVAEVSMEVVASEGVAPASGEPAVESQIDIEKACADFKVDAVIATDYESDSKT